MHLHLDLRPLARTAGPALALLALAATSCTRHQSTQPARGPVLSSLVFQTRSEIDIGAAGAADALLQDLNGDGALDLAVTTLSDRLQILLGTGNGTFSPAQSLEAEGFAFNVRAGDVDGDSDLDLLVLRTDADRVSVYENDGNATFTLTQQLAVPAEGNGLAVGDCNGDGALDIATSHLGSSDLTVWDGIGDGTFVLQPPLSLPTGVSAAGLIVADPDADGEDELVVADTEGDAVYVLRAPGNGAIDIEQVVNVPEFPLALSVGDLDQDGLPDIAVSSFDARTVTVLTNNGAGGFSTWRTFTFESPPSLNAIEDANGDGRQDLIVSVFDRARTAVYFGTEQGDLASPVKLSASGLPFRPLVGDVTGDGSQDLLVTGSGTSVINLYRGDARSYAASVTYDPGLQRPEVVAAEDLDGDGRAEVAVADIGGTEIVLATIPPTSSDVRDLRELQRFDFGLTLLGVIAVDIDGDGDTDFAVNTDEGIKIIANTTVARQVVFTAIPSAPPEVLLSAQGPFDVAAADLDGDGRRDLIATDAIAETVSVLQATGPNFAYEAQPFVLPVAGVPGGVVAGDFDGDGRNEVAVSRNRAALVQVLDNAGSGSLAAGLEVPVGALPNYLRGADFDQDGQLDLAVSNAATDEVTVLISRNGTFVPRVLSVGSVPTGLLAADLNRDGADDVLTVSNASGDTRILLGDGAGSFGTQQRFPGTYRATSVALSDIDGDGLPDLVVGSAETRGVNVYRNVSPAISGTR